MLNLTVASLAMLLGAVPAAHAEGERSDWLDIELGKSIVIELPGVPRAISVTNPLVADIQQLGSAMRWQVQGKSLGTTDLIIQFADRPPMIYEVTVHRDLSELVRRIDSMVDGPAPRIYPLNNRIVIEGEVADINTMERIALVASTYDPEYINLLSVRGDHQVQLEVIFAEVNRTKVRDLGFNFFWQGSDASVSTQYGRKWQLIPGQPVQYDPNPTAFNMIGGIAAADLLFAIESLDEHGLAKLIAQPTLVALSGQQAEFLSGGMLPLGFPNAQGNVLIKFKEFGTRMLFIPTVLADDVIDVQIELEMSAVDTSIGATVNGISVPGFTSRKVISHVRLRSGTTFALAGLLTEQTNVNRQEMPLLGRIPILGTLFRRMHHERNESELMVYITPRIVRPIAAGELPPILGTTENNNPNDFAIFFLGADHRPKSRTAKPTGDIGLQR